MWFAVSAEEADVVDVFLPSERRIFAALAGEGSKPERSMIDVTPTSRLTAPR